MLQFFRESANSRKKTPPQKNCGGVQTIKKLDFEFCCCKPSAEFRQLADGIKLNLKFPGTCASEISLLSLQTCEQSECAAAGCKRFEKMLAFSRERVNLFDTLNSAAENLRRSGSDKTAQKFPD